MLTVDGRHFKDEFGRVLMLRGVNLGGSSKLPSCPDGATYRRDGLEGHREVSFVGRPFPLGEADSHLRRLREWGLTFLRFLVTWEAVEHGGPGHYDEEYLDYLRAVVERAGHFGFTILIDPHQDVWSRFSGGDGAPGWTLEAAGFDLGRLHETGAAFVHAYHGDHYPRMIWPTNADKLASATMFTLFFAGNELAPLTKAAREPIQEYLQRHYLGAMQKVAARLQDLPQVVGYDVLNEPSRGWIGRRDLNSTADTLTLGACPTPFQSMLLGAGLPQSVERWRVGLTGLKRDGTEQLNPGGLSAWRTDSDCVWRLNGVWDLEGGRPRLLRPDHFVRAADGREIDFNRDCYRPFANRFAAAIRAIDPTAIVFLETDPEQPQLVWGKEDADRVVFAPHWYDGYVLVKKEYSPWVAVDALARRPVFGPRAIRRSFARQLAALRQSAKVGGGGEVPVLLGEFGIPFDLNGKKAYRTGNFRAQEEALDRSLQAVEANLLSATLWNYTPDNTNAHGDGWNDEDLSLFSRDQQSDPGDLDSGGRALRAVVRPYPRALAGVPLSLAFDYRRRIFILRFRHDPQINAPTEIFLPRLQYPEGCRVLVSDGTFEVLPEVEMLIYRHGLDQKEHTIRILPGPRR